MKQRTKTYHANRRLQHFQKRKCQANPIRNPFLEILMNSIAVMQQFHPNGQESNEESSKEEDTDNGQIDNKTTCLNQRQSMEEGHTWQRRTVYLSVDKWKLSTKLVPKYSQLRPSLFKHLLGKSIPHYSHQIHQYLRNPNILSFIQKYAHLMCTIFQLEMERDYWQHVVKGVLSVVHWLLKMPKNLTQRYSINWDYPRTESNIRHRQRLTENKLDQTIRELQLHLEQYSSYFWSTADQTSLNPIMALISQALIVLIQEDLHELHTKYEEKKILIQYDVYDVYLSNLFYELHPTEAQKSNVEKIWRSKRRFCQRTIHHIKTDSSDKRQAKEEVDISSMFKGNNRLYIDYDYQQDQVCFVESLNSVMRTIVETRQANIENRTKQILAFANNSLSNWQ